MDNKPSNITPLHRGVVQPPRDYAEPARFVRPIEPEQMARIMGEPVDLNKSLEHRYGLLDRIADALGSDRGFFTFIGWTIGLATAALFLAVWSL